MLVINNSKQTWPKVIEKDPITLNQKVFSIVSEEIDVELLSLGHLCHSILQFYIFNFLEI